MPTTRCKLQVIRHQKVDACVFNLIIALQKAYKPPVAANKDKYYQLLRGKSGASSSTDNGEREDDDIEMEAAAEMEESVESDPQDEGQDGSFDF